MKETFAAAAQLTHIALQVKDVEASVAFYKKWCGMEVVDPRRPGVKGETSVWLACKGQEDQFVIVLLPGGDDTPKKEGMRHLGFALPSRDDIRKIADEAKREGLLHWEYQDHGYPVGTLCSIKDPDGHIVEFSYGQPLGLYRDAENDNKKEGNSGDLKPRPFTAPGGGEF